MARKVSAAGQARHAKSMDAAARRAVTKKRGAVADSYQNFAANLGIGTNNVMSSSTYGFNPITRNRILLEWMHRGAWLAGVAVDLIADDMTREGVELLGDIDPEEIEEIEGVATDLGIWNTLRDGVKWGRLYGGAIVVLLIDGQLPDSPLDVSRVGKGQFKGLLVLDRWQVQPTLDDLVTDYGPYLGLPKFYKTSVDTPGLRNAKIHYSRVIRLIGISLPYQQRLVENLWGISVLERIYDRLVAFDSATQGAAQLIYKSYLRTYKIKDLRSIMANGGQALNGLIRTIEFMRKYQTDEGMTLLDGEDEFGTHESTAARGVADVLIQFGQQISGALQVPLVRLFGQSPAGLNSTGESDLQTYYNGIGQQQERDLKVGVTAIYVALMLSMGKKIPKSFRIKFKALWEIKDTEKAQITTAITSAVIQAFESNIIDRKTAMDELRQSSDITGVFSNISDEALKEAENDPPMPSKAELLERNDLDKDASDKDKKTQDAARRYARTVDRVFSQVHGLDVAIENVAGSLRHPWPNPLPADYGYIRNTVGADGDAVDCYVGPLLDHAPCAYIVNMCDPMLRFFDEHKVFLGYPTVDAVWADIQSAYGEDEEAARKRVLDVHAVTLDELKRWLASGDCKNQYRPLRVAA